MLALRRARMAASPPFLRGGFRPFFFLGALWAVVALALWLLVLWGVPALPTAFPPLAWHRHEMLFGFVGAVVAGFLLTAIPNWTGRLPIAGLPLAGLAGLWAAARLAVLFSAVTGPAVAALLDIGFYLVLAGFAAREVLAAMLALAVPLTALAQDVPRPLVWDLARSVLIDPTTYAPAALSYGAQRLDWKTSRVLIDHGWLEQNPRFTVSGRPNDVAISYAAGNKKIRREALAQLQQSVTANLLIGIGERILVAKYPEHGKLFRALSWGGRITAASWMAYLASAEHFRQIGTNRRLTHEYGYSH